MQEQRAIHNEQLKKHLQTPMEQRDLQWEYRFFDLFAQSNVKVVSPDAQVGPDGWPYLIVETSEGATEHAQKVIQWLALKGIGLVVNPQQSYPDFVFNYGMLWHFREHHLFIQTQSQVTKAGPLEIAEGQKILAGAPSATYLPDYVRNILRDFFRDQGLFNVKILVMSQDQKHFDLCFSLESLGQPAQNEHEGIAEAISWFLPQHYSLVLVSEKNLPPFVAL